jgi:translation initiation factor 5B
MKKRTSEVLWYAFTSIHLRRADSDLAFAP